MVNRRRFLQALGFSAIGVPLIKVAEILPSPLLTTPPAIPATVSVASFATHEEACSGVCHDMYMTPLRVSEYVKANLQGMKTCIHG